MWINVLLLLSSLFAFEREDYQINRQFKAGPFLIYHCVDQFFACVDQAGFEKCKEMRNELNTVGKKKKNCAPLKEFSEKKECLQEQYRVSALTIPKRYCH